MLELLVSLVVMSVGVLGMVGLHLASMQQTRGALFQSEATLRAGDLLERIRANPAAGYGAVRFAADPRSVSNCAASTCSANAMRDFDIAQWQCAINSTDGRGEQHGACVTLGVVGALPGGDCADETSGCAGGSVVLSGNIYQATVKWAEPAGARSITLSMRRP